MLTYETFLPEEPEDFSKARLRLIGNYQLIRRIGVGGMGEVHLAKHRQFAQREYAIKFIRREVASDAARMRFEREIVAMGGLIHPNLVYASDAGIDNDRMYLVMEYVRGEDLQKLIDAKGPFRVGFAAEVLRQICAGVAHAHEHGVVHRDIKPANVLLSDECDVKVLDLGIASLQSDIASRMTRGGSLMGTAAFIAPELWDDALEASPASDVYAIGCTAYCLLTGKPPYHGEAFQSLAQVMTAHQQVDPVPLHELRTDIPIDLSLVVLKSLHKLADRRFQHAAEFAEMLRPYCEVLTPNSDLFVSSSGTNHIETSSIARASKSEVLPTEISLASIVSNPIRFRALIASVLMLGIATISLYHAYCDERVTAQWTLAFGRLGDLRNSRWLGLACDASILLITVPLSCFALGRYYPSEVRRTFNWRSWDMPASFVRAVLLSCLLGLTLYHANTYWAVAGLPAKLAELAQVPDAPAAATAESQTVRAYFGFVFINKILFPIITLFFPLAWFFASDLWSLRSRYSRLIFSQKETSFPGRMSENLHRYGIDLREKAGRVLAMAFIAAIVIQYNYWLCENAYQGLRKQLFQSDALLNAYVLVILCAAVVGAVIFAFLQGFEATQKLMSICGSLKDEAELSKIGAWWLVQKTVFSGLSGIGCFSVLAVPAHSFWKQRSASSFVSPNTIEAIMPSESSINNEDLDLPPRPSWLPIDARPTSDSVLVAIDLKGGTEWLYSKVYVPLTHRDVADSSVSSEAENIDPCVFMLIPQVNQQSPPSFYMMQRKVTVGQFARFEAAYQEQVDDAAAKKRSAARSEPLLPVYGVTGNEAIRFAKTMFDGSLPTPQQWDSAFGRFVIAEDLDKSLHQSSDYRSIVKRYMTLAVSDRNGLLDLEVSPWGCLEMGSKGLEFTRYDAHWRMLVPHSGPTHSLQLRGRSQLSDDGPLRLDEWEASGIPDNFLFGTRPVDEPSEEIGFRVVIGSIDE